MTVTLPETGRGAHRALIVDDDLEILALLSKFVAGEGFEVSCASTLEDARASVAAGAPDILLVDVQLPDGSGLQLLDELRTGDAEIVLITGRASVETAVEALRHGAADYLTKPLDLARLKMLLGNVNRALRLKGDIGDLRSELRRMGRFGAMVGASAPMQSVYDLVARVARTDAATLVSGETGTGKEIVARTIHDLGRRAREPFVAVDCGSVSPNLIESELFGHERGSFTGADRLHKGYFERAHRGTLFLDEITETPPELQVKLLRVLETSSITRVGAETTIPIDVRVIAATNRTLEAALAEGRLREDLFYRLNVFPIALPPLRERAEDVDLLAEHFLAQLNAHEGTSKRLSPGTGANLRRHDWPGNLRELRNAVHRAFILAGEGGMVEVVAERAPEAPPESLSIAVGTPLAESERQLVLAALGQAGGDRRKAAKALKIKVADLRERLRQYEA